MGDAGEPAFRTVMVRDGRADAVVRQDSKPAPYVGDMKDSAQFYANRVIKDSKETCGTPVPPVKLQLT